jgi:predicted LPLAT superfamily acyltransferase
MAERLDPGTHIRLIEIEPDSPTFVFRIKACVDRGELVAILADRVGLGGGVATVDFLGARAPMPTGPYALAAALGCPVYFTAGLYRAPDRYDLHCEPFAERVVLPRATRKAALAGYAQEFADRLARHTRMAPDNWFNFYDFWRAAANDGEDVGVSVREAM